MGFSDGAGPRSADPRSRPSRHERVLSECITGAVVQIA
jgi:hypothetical protein